MTTPTSPVNEHRVALGRCLGLGAILIPLFAVVDVFVKLTLFPDANLVLVETYRALGVVSAVVGWLVVRDLRFSDRTAQVAHTLSLAGVAAVVTALAFELGGLTSVYVHGLSVIIMVRAATVPAPLGDSLLHGVLIAVIYPVIFAILYAVDPITHAHWLDPKELAVFFAQWLLVLASILCGCLASRASWLAQKQLVQARRLGRYRLQAKLGRGGQGEVWLARDSTHKRNVALKVLATTASPHAIQLFEREAELASRLESPHAVKIFDFGASDDGIYYLAMEHLDGADLGALLTQHGPMPAARVVHFGIHACRSLEEAHAKGLVHRDVKPSNLFAARVADTYDHLKLLDYGVARSVDDEQLTRTGVMRGTLGYIAPEVCRGEPAGPAADIYGLGATLYHLLAGSPPFSGDAAELITKHLDVAPEPLHARLGQPVDPELETTILRCLAKTPSDRFGDAAALRAALERCAARLAWTAEDAVRFWRDDRGSALRRWEAETVA